MVLGSVKHPQPGQQYSITVLFCTDENFKAENS